MEKSITNSSQGRFKGPIDCAWQTLKYEGPFGFYKGFTPPLVGWVFMDSIMLGSLHTYRELVKDYIYPQEKKLPLVGHMIAGLGSGLTVSFVAAPIEQCKARLQVQYDKNQELIVVLLMLLKSVSSSWDKRYIFRFDINDDFQNQFYILVGVIRNFHSIF